VIPNEMKGIAKLSLADQRAALKQRLCPVTRDLLGSMGKPHKVNVLGRTVFVCCQGCVDEIRENPREYLRDSAP
jgi:Cu(I)/Ag(I) efflux system membrane fusion protein